MKNLGYWLLKLCIKAGLHLYYGKIKISGLEHVPKGDAVLFLPNHQGALMDVLLIVTKCRRKPYFLTRSDVFNRPSLKNFFAFLRMLPIYRIRDGRESLKKNQAIFDTCARLFREKHALVMFPEASHNIKRCIRPLSKGFTRVVFNSLEKVPSSEIKCIPVGMNYRSNIGFPDKVAVHYGKPISTKGIYEKHGNKKGGVFLKDAVSDNLKTLTTHIADAKTYNATIGKLDALAIDYLNPAKANTAIRSGKASNIKKGNSALLRALSVSVKAIFTMFNWPLITIWRTWVKPKIWEPEFTSTLRFGFALISYPIYYLIIFAFFAVVLSAGAGFAIALVLMLFNWGYVRWY